MTSSSWPVEAFPLSRLFREPIPRRLCPQNVGDADRIKERARNSKRAVVIGGGLLGLEAGNGLRKMGLSVSVVEFFPRLLPARWTCRVRKSSSG